MKRRERRGRGEMLFAVLVFSLRPLRSLRFKNNQGSAATLDHHWRLGRASFCPQFFCHIFVFHIRNFACAYARAQVSGEG